MNVDMDRNAQVRRQSADALQRRGRDGIGGMRGKGGADQGIALQRLVQSQSFVQIFIQVAGVGGGEVQGNQPDAGADAAFAGDGGGRFREKVHVVEAGGAAAASQRLPVGFRHGRIRDRPSGFRWARYGLAARPSAADRPASPAQQGHAGMGMSVDQTGDENVRCEVQARLGAEAGHCLVPRQDGEECGRPERRWRGIREPGLPVRPERSSGR